MSYAIATSHNWIACDNCGRRNFEGLRFRCLICMDYSLCSQCQDKGIHQGNHPVQCIITSTLRELFFGGEPDEVEPPQSLTCPHCGELGFSLRTLMEHVGKQHLMAANEVLCPACVCENSEEDGLGDMDYVTDNLALHLVLKHGTTYGQPQEVIRSVDQWSDELRERETERETESVLRMMTRSVSNLRTFFRPGSSFRRDQALTTHRRPLEQRRLSSRFLSLREPNPTFFSKQIFSIKDKIEKFRNQAVTITEINDDDSTEHSYLLPQMVSSTQSTLEMKSNLRELWYRAEFVQLLLMSLLAKKDLSDINTEVPAIEYKDGDGDGDRDTDPNGNLVQNLEPTKGEDTVQRTEL